MGSERNLACPPCPLSVVPSIQNINTEKCSSTVSLSHEKQQFGTHKCVKRCAIKNYDRFLGLTYISVRTLSTKENNKHAQNFNGEKLSYLIQKRVLFYLIWYCFSSRKTQHCRQHTNKLTLRIFRSFRSVTHLCQSTPQMNNSWGGIDTRTSRWS